MLVRIDITQEHIDKGGFSCANCPGARAINEWLTPLYMVDVGQRLCNIYDKSTMLRPGLASVWNFTTPLELNRFIGVYDFNKKAAVPTTFVVDIPEIYLDVFRVIKANARIIRT